MKTITTILCLAFSLPLFAQNKVFHFKPIPKPPIVYDKTGVVGGMVDDGYKRIGSVTAGGETTTVYCNDRNDCTDEPILAYYFHADGRDFEVLANPMYGEKWDGNSLRLLPSGEIRFRWAKNDGGPQYICLPVASDTKHQKETCYDVPTELPKKADTQ